MKFAISYHHSFSHMITGDCQRRISERDWLLHTHLSHVFFGGEHKLVIDNPAGLFLEQAAVRVDHHGLKEVLRVKWRYNPQN